MFIACLLESPLTKFHTVAILVFIVFAYCVKLAIG